MATTTKKYVEGASAPTRPSTAIPHLRPGVDKMVYRYLLHKLEEIPRLRVLSNDDDEARAWRMDLLYNVGIFFGTHSAPFERINVFRAIDPRAFVSEERRRAFYQSRHEENLDRLKDAIVLTLTEMEAGE